MNVKQSVQTQFGRAAERYARSFVHRQGADLDALVEHAAFAGRERVLDVGCGAGHTAFACAARAGHVEALDLTPEMLQQVEQGANERGLGNLSTRLGDAEALPYPDASFDVVTTRLCAHHFPHPAAAIREMARVLGPRGRLLLSDSVAPDDPTQDTFLQTFELLRDPSHVRDHSESQWMAMLREAGLEPCFVGSWPMHIDFDAWIERMGTPKHSADEIRSLFAKAPAEVRSAFAIEDGAGGSFSLTISVLSAQHAAGG